MFNDMSLLTYKKNPYIYMTMHKEMPIKIRK